MTLLLLACGSDPESSACAPDDTATTSRDTTTPTDDTSTTARDDTAASGDDTGSQADDTAPECVKSPPADSAPSDTGPDADGDGVTSEDGDCDDQDARVYPGALDACDGVDQDCDGEAQPPGSCAGVVFLESSAEGQWTGGERSTQILLDEAETDFDGDGVSDLLFHSECSLSEDGWACASNILYVAGRIPGSAEAVPADCEPWFIGDPYVTKAGSAGDFDGDGTIDLLLLSTEGDPSFGQLAVVLGPPERWPARGDTARAAAAGWWWDGDGSGGQPIASGGYDADGDGMDDILVPGQELTFFPGRTTLPSGGSYADEVWFESFAYDSTMLPDLDGDGLGEAAVSEYISVTAHTSSFILVPPELLQDRVSGTLVTDGDVLSSVQYLGKYFVDESSAVGDVNGDGQVDVTIGVSFDGDGDGEPEEGSSVYLYGDTRLRMGTLDEHIGGEVRGYVSRRTTDDIDQDGLRDVALNCHDDDYATCLIASSQRPLSGWEDLQDVRPYCFTTEGENWVSPGTAVDLDGDGLPEIIDGSYETWCGGVKCGSILVSPGFVIPFDDDSKW